MYKWRISAPGIVINNPKIIDLFSYKFYGGPHKGGFGIVNYNPRRTYCPLVPKQYTFNAIKVSAQFSLSFAALIVGFKYQDACNNRVMHVKQFHISQPCSIFNLL